jgi:hypothetical protein
MGPFIALIAIYSGICLVLWFAGNRRKCPTCRRYQLRWMEAGVFYNPAPPKRKLYRCRACQAEFVRFQGRWVQRCDWKDEDDQELFDRLNGTSTRMCTQCRYALTDDFEGPCPGCGSDIKVQKKPN